MKEVETWQGYKCLFNHRQAYGWSASTLVWQVNFATIANPFFQWPVWKAIHKFGDNS